MNDQVQNYIALIDRFLSGELSAQDFRERYFEFYQREGRLPDRSFQILDGLFADLDAFEPDPQLFRELSAAHPGAYLDQPGLKLAVQRARDALLTT